MIELLEIRHVLKEFTQGTTLAAWVSQWCFQGLDSLGHGISDIHERCASFLAPSFHNVEQQQEGSL
tara:strand:+ start:617 stop:814 length:198 start_codon:yes stop_codon:yes gene_type:complete